MDEGDLAGELGEEGGLLDGGIATTDHGDLLAAEEEAVAGGAGGQPVPEEALFGLQTQHQRASTGRDDDRLGRELLITDPDLEGPSGEVDPGDLLGEELGPEPLGLGAEVRHQLGTHDALGKPGEVLDLGGQHQLAPRLVAGGRRLTLDDQGSEVGACGVDGRGQPGGARADDDDVACGHGGSLTAAVRTTNVTPSATRRRGRTVRRCRRRRSRPTCRDRGARR